MTGINAADRARTSCGTDPTGGDPDGDRNAQLAQEQVAAVKGLLNPADKILGLAAERVGNIDDSSTPVLVNSRALMEWTAPSS